MPLSAILFNGNDHVERFGVVTPKPVIVTAGTRHIDVSVVPYMRYVPIVIQTRNLKPFANANVWIDDVRVNQFTQPSSYLKANANFTFAHMSRGEGLYCNNTHAYAQVMEYSVGGSVCYIDENYLTLNLATYGPNNSNSFTKTTYNVGDIVFQTSNNGANVYLASMVGQVVYWANQDGALVITINSGHVSNAAGNLILRKSGSGTLANVLTVVSGEKFPAGTSVVSTKNVNAILTVGAWDSYHGVVPFAVANANTVHVNGRLNSNVVNSSFYITSGGGIGQNAKIITVAAGSSNTDTYHTVITLNTALTGIIGNSYYGIGNVVIDEIGIGAAICRVPEDAAFKFPTGARLITINDGRSSTDNTATMLATATFMAAGQLLTNQGVAFTPGVPPTPLQSASANTTVAPSTPTSTGINNNSQSNNPTALATPLVQTFFTPKPLTNKTDNGIFCSSVNLYFRQKPTGSGTKFPVDVYLVQTVNGYPTSTILGSVAVRWENIATTDGVVTYPSAANTATATKFSFPDPIYLAPGTEYGLVVYSESPDYDVWAGILGQLSINQSLAGVRLASTPPYVGQFFKAQNASAWTPIPNQFLMFTLNKAQFSLTPAAVQLAVQPYSQNTYIDQIIVHSSDLTLPPANVAYGLKSLTANSGVQDAGYFSIQKDTPYSFGADLNSSTSNNNRRRVIDAGNANALLMNVTMSTSDPDVSPFVHQEALSALGFTNIINAGELNNTQISIITAGNHINAANIVVTIDAPTGDLATQATANVLAAGLSGNNVIAVNIINPGGGYIVTPNITISEASAPSNATALINGETNQFGGNGKMRYITRHLTLANGFDAGDIVVYMDAIRPQGTDIRVYYKVLSSIDTQTLDDKQWQILTLSADVFSPDQKTPVQLTFNTGVNNYGIPNGSVVYTLNGIQYPIGGKFASYQLKIVGFAKDSTVPPVILNWRGIAVPAG
jgi:hypothetical protein